MIFGKGRRRRRGRRGRYARWSTQVGVRRAMGAGGLAMQRLLLLVYFLLLVTEAHGVMDGDGSPGDFTVATVCTAAAATAGAGAVAAAVKRFPCGFGTCRWVGKDQRALTKHRKRKNHPAKGVRRGRSNRDEPTRYVAEDRRPSQASNDNEFFDDFPVPCLTGGKLGKSAKTRKALAAERGIELPPPAPSPAPAAATATPPPVPALTPASTDAMCNVEPAADNMDVDDRPTAAAAQSTPHSSLPSHDTISITKTAASSGANMCSSTIPFIAFRAAGCRSPNTSRMLNMMKTPASTCRLSRRALT